ncbi:MAG: hypothetical protein AB7J63_16330, partial [Vicinamibacterales bacterium]
YGRRNSRLVDPADEQTGTPMSAAGDFVTMIGALGLFNGLFMTLLAYMTEAGITTEATAKWYEIGVTPEGADVLGWQVLGLSAVVFIAGLLVSRAGSRSGNSPAR